MPIILANHVGALPSTHTVGNTYAIQYMVTAMATGPINTFCTIFTVDAISTAA